MSEQTILPIVDAATPEPGSRVRELGQYPTPCWVAEALVERHFPDLDEQDLVLDPTAGPGHFLQAIPAHVPALGIEIDPALAARARARSGRRILEGDAATVQMDLTPTAILGNPPFRADFISRLLDRAHAWLPQGGRAGLILPAYYFSGARTVVSLSARWSLYQEMLPRTIYPHLRLPIVFAIFSKDERRTLVGFALYRETQGVQGLARSYRDILESGSRSVWWAVVHRALSSLGGEADLVEIYHEIEGRRPTPNPHWKAKIRQVVQSRCERVGPARYALIASAA